MKLNQPSGSVKARAARDWEDEQGSGREGRLSAFAAEKSGKVVETVTRGSTFCLS